MNKSLLEYEMSKRNISKGYMCQRLGMSRSAFYRKCNGLSEFTQSEIQTIITVLDEVEKTENPMSIFFGQEVS